METLIEEYINEVHPEILDTLQECAEPDDIALRTIQNWIEMCPDLQLA